LYDIARSGDVAAQQAVEIKARPVRVMQCELVDGRVDENGQFRLRIQCGGGCYIRSIIHDLAQELGTAAHMTELVRVRQGLFSLPGACGGVGDEETIPVLSVEQLTEYEALCGFIETHESQIDAYVKRCAASVASTQQAAKQHNNKRNASPAKDRSPFIKQKCEPSEDIAGGTNASADINI
jgi:tRNA U55 pseudouridine synthase TruB